MINVYHGESKIEDKTLEKLEEIKVLLSKILDSEKETPHPMGLFHKSLRNSQPIAFLASLSIVIAAFTFSNEELQFVSTYAAIAGLMFLFSFIASLGNQINPINKNDRYYEYYDKMSRYGAYTFLAIGVCYLLALAYQFGKSFSEIHMITSGYVLFFAGFFTIYVSIKYRIGKIEFYQGFWKFVYVVETIAGTATRVIMILWGVSTTTEYFISFKIISDSSTHFISILVVIFLTLLVVRERFHKQTDEQT